MEIKKILFGTLHNTPVHKFIITNDHGVEIAFLDYGCTITNMITPDRQGNLENIVLGYDRLDDYLQNNAFFGSIVGRVAGRISNAEFQLNGQTYSLAKNESVNHIHGGVKGFDKVIWDSDIDETSDEASVLFSYISPDGEEGYPGNIRMTVIYTLNNKNEFTIRYEGMADQQTILNVTNHSYFNLSGDIKRDVLDHSLTLKSENYLELKADLIPTGKIVPVQATPFDFRNGRSIRSGTESDYPQNHVAGGGYDHPFVLDASHDQEIVLTDPESGRTLTVETDEVGVVVYTANQLEGDTPIYGVAPRKHLGICLETQGLPDAVNHEHFPSWIIEEDKPFTSITKYTFGVV